MRLSVSPSAGIAACFWVSLLSSVFVTANNCTHGLIVFCQQNLRFLKAHAVLGELVSLMQLVISLAVAVLRPY